MRSKAGVSENVVWYEKNKQIMTRVYELRAVVLRVCVCMCVCVCVRACVVCVCVCVCVWNLRFEPGLFV